VLSNQSEWIGKSVKCMEKTILSLSRLFDKIFMEENRIGYRIK
jgi:hypothetical protein